MDNEIKLGKEREKFLRLCFRFAERFADKHCKTDHEKIACVQHLAIEFLGNMTFKFFNADATKQDVLNLIRITNDALQNWYTQALNDIDFKPRITVQ